MRKSTLGVLILACSASPLLADPTNVYPWRWTDTSQSDWMGGRVEDTSAAPLTTRLRANFDGLNLSQAWFRGYNSGPSSFMNSVLTSADFANANRIGLKFNSSDLMYSNFTNANIANVSFGYVAPYTAAQLVGARFDNAQVLGTSNFQGVIANGASFAGAKFQYADFSFSDLQYASFRNADLGSSNFSKAEILNADFSREASATGTALSWTQLASTKSYADKNLSGVALGGLDWSTRSFADLNLTGASFRNANLTNASFYKALVAKADFVGSGLTVPQLMATASYSNKDLQGISLGGLNLSSANFDGQDLKAASLAGATLSSASLLSADLTNATLADADLSNTKLNNALIGGADFSRGASAVGSQLSASQFFSTLSAYQKDLNGVKFDGMTMTSASGWNFVEQSLVGSSFRNAQMAGISLYRARLNQANYDGANLTNANLSSSAEYGAAQHASFRGAILDGANFIGRDLSHSNFQGASITGASLSGSPVDFADFRGATGSLTTTYPNAILPDGHVSGNGKIILGYATPFTGTILPHALPVQPSIVAVLANNTLDIQNGAAVITPSVTIESGGHIINNGDVTVSQLFSIRSGGLLSGDGTITGYVRNQGTIAPGNSPGILTIDGNLDNLGGTILMEIAGAGAGQYDQVVVNGDLTPGGTIKVVFTDGFQPSADDQFNLISWTGTVNQGNFAFDTTEAVAPNGLCFTPTWSSQGLSFVAAVPEPSIIGIAAAFSGVALMPRPARRRKA